MSNTSNVLKAPAGGRYERGWCEPDPQKAKQCIDARAPKDKVRVARDKFVRDLNPFLSKKLQKQMRNPAWRARQIAQLSAALKKQAWYEEVGSNLMSAERWKALPGNLRRAPVILGAAVAAAFGAGCVYDVTGLAPPDGTVQPDAARHDAGDAEIDAGQLDGGPDADAETPVNDQPTITWPYFNTLPNNRAFVRWNPPLETEPGKTLVGYEVSWSDASNNYSKEVTFPFTAIDILAPNMMYSITVRARYDDASYGQDSTQVGVIADTSLLARYTMDEGAGNMILDSSVNGNHGTLVNFDPLTAWTQGIIGTGLLFDGVDSYVDTGDTFNFDLDDPFTIEAWVKRGTVGNHLMTIFGRMDRTDTVLYRGYLFGFWDTNELWLSLNSDSSENDLLIITSATQFSAPGVAHHVGVTYNGSMLAVGAKLFADSAEQQTLVEHDTLSGTTQNAVPSRIGAAIATNGPIQDTSHEIHGIIDDLAIYNRDLTPDEILNNNCSREALHSEEVSDASDMPVNCN